MDIEMLQPFIRRYALHFCHELYNFANCPYDNVIDYDHNTINSSRAINLPMSEQLAILDQIQTATRTLSYIETIAPDSDDEENIETDTRLIPPEVIVHESSSDESDMEILDIISRPIETYESPSADQPSTSTGIRHSVEPPNNSYNPTTQHFSNGGTRTVGCSLSDEESISDVQTVSKKRKRQVETNKSKRVKKSTDVGRRSYSESSSSDDEDV